MKTQRAPPVQWACGLNSENKNGVLQAEMSGAGPEPGHPRVELILHPNAKGSLRGV